MYAYWKIMVKAVSHFINSGLSCVEQLMAKDADGRLCHTPIFIIGIPRSGTTLLYQLLIKTFQFGYFGNIHHCLYGAPFIAEIAARMLLKGNSMEFKSEFGLTKGLLGPSEAGNYWYRFFGSEQGKISVLKANQNQILRRSLNRFMQAVGKDCVFKNTVNVLRFSELAKILPEALFIVIERDPLETASSILSARKKIFGSYNEWWSVEPENIAELRNLPAGQQVAGQVAWLGSYISTVKLQIDSPRVFNLTYEGLCKNPTEVLDELSVFFQQRGLQIDYQSEPTQSFLSSNPSQTLPTSLVDDIKLYFGDRDNKQVTNHFYNQGCR